MGASYNINDFNRYLKLGIWSSGLVDFWGYVETISPKNDYLLPTKANKQYNSDSWIIRHLDLGVYLLGLSFVFRNKTSQTNVYHLAVAICRNDMRHLEKIYHLRVTNEIPIEDFLSIVSNPERVLEHATAKSRRASTYTLHRRGRHGSSRRTPSNRYSFHR